MPKVGAAGPGQLQETLSMRAATVVVALDTDGDGSIDANEFLAADTDGDGRISKQEFCQETNMTVTLPLEEYEVMTR